MNTPCPINVHRCAARIAAAPGWSALRPPGTASWCGGMNWRACAGTHAATGLVAADDPPVEGVHQFLMPLVTPAADPPVYRRCSVAMFRRWTAGYLVRVTAAAANPPVFVAASRPIEPRTPITCCCKRWRAKAAAAPHTRSLIALDHRLAQQISPLFDIHWPTADAANPEGNPYILSD